MSEQLPPVLANLIAYSAAACAKFVEAGSVAGPAEDEQILVYTALEEFPVISLFQFQAVDAQLKSVTWWRDHSEGRWDAIVRLYKLVRSTWEMGSDDPLQEMDDEYDAVETLMFSTPSPSPQAFAFKYLAAHGGGRDANHYDDVLEAEAKRFAEVQHG